MRWTTFCVRGRLDLGCGIAVGITIASILEVFLHAIIQLEIASVRFHDVLADCAHHLVAPEVSPCVGPYRHIRDSLEAQSPKDIDQNRHGVAAALVHHS